ncbi:MAG: primosomal protein N' [Clostridiales bacterium]|nr:primosomal protein N' [Clostridiales bacterium]
MFAEIIVDIAAEQVDRVFTYRVPEGMDLSPGTRVTVPFGKREKEGFVIRLRETPDYDEAKIRPVLSTLEAYPAVLPKLMELAFEIREKAHCPLCEALRLMLPAEMRGGRVKVKTEECARLQIPADRIDEAIAAQSRSAKRRLLITLLSDGEWHPVEELRGMIRDVREPLKWLTDREMAQITQREILRSPYYGIVDAPPDPELTEEQKEALEELLPALTRGAKPFLIHGVTGSGKTEVYIRLVRRALEMGKGAIILVPEIVLTPQMINWFRSRFGDTMAVLHSRLSPGERFDEWRRIRLGRARIVIGARSAVFAPVENLGVVIVDEEHEQTYLSDRFPRYDARDVAISRAKREGAAAVLASATPSIYSYAMCRRGDYTLIEMPRRVLDRPLPRVYVTDMREELRKGNRGMFSALLKEKLDACISAGQQAMLFINRRGYASSVNCRRCGETIKCSRCDVSMTYHSVDKTLRCHWCGEIRPMPKACPACQSPYIRPMGVGTQKVEEELNRLYPGAGVIRMDMDTTSGKNAHFDLVNRFRAGQAQILLGTQMIAKGLDFPQVTLVGAVMADMTLNFPDYRSPERTFQLLVQVAGRAGRGEKPGEVVIQTYQPEHYAIRAAAAQDYRAFFREEFQRRRQDLYPPFTMMARFLCESRSMDAAKAAAESIRDGIIREFGGSALEKRILFIRADEAPISRIQDRARAHVLMKLLNHPDTERLLERFQEMAGEEHPAHVVLEINPASLA